MSPLVHQRVKYLVEYGGLHAESKPASKYFVIKAVILIVALTLCHMYLHILFR